MKILYDYQIFDTQKIGGVSRYFYELITHFNEDDSVEWQLPILYSSNEYLKNSSLFKNKFLPNPTTLTDQATLLSKLSFVNDKLSFKIKNFVNKDKIDFLEYEKNKLNSINEIKKGNFDVFHPTYYDDYFLQYIENKPFVLTVHDLMHQIFPEFLLHHPIDKHKELLNKAKKIIAISESTKKDLINIFGIEETKVEVVYHANSFSENSIGAVSEEFKNKLPQKYLLYVGSRADYKNFLFFAQMFASLKRGNEDLYIVCTGSPFNASEQYLFKKLGIEKYVFNTFVNDDELVYLYKNAIAFVFPSMYEGFGLPVLEAFSCGCPAVISNTSSLSEIGEDAVVYFEPKNPASMLHALESVIGNPSLRQGKIAKGYEQLKKYSWEKTAMQTRQVYEKVFLDMGLEAVNEQGN